MPARKITDQEVFEVARQLESREARKAYLSQVCRDNAAMAQRIEALLRAYEGSASFLESPAVAPTIDQPGQPPIGEKPGTQIGPYKLLQQIGEGGMGAVFMAEQTHPVQRKVALKLIKPGLDNRQVIARFEAERQALALMDHPHIARVLDAGTTESGQPYFVMELVHGVAITKYCDQHRLTPRQRLELFVPVCQAIQHAHQKGIIHRDIKPSNVMVTIYDGKPVPKVIDFGVAKAVGQKLTDSTMFTEFGSIVGTLEYMSPEQAERNQFDIDTRSDIYSLGVLLYELLTGSTPLDKKHLRGAAFLEMLRIIQEDEPPRPSTRLSTTDELPSIAANRSLEPKKLSGLVRGELDWIVMKALEKDRNRRYETANGFAMDIQRYLADEQVLACPPSVGYRLRKLARRNKAALATTALVALALLVGTAVSTWQAIRATKAEGLARTRLVAETRARTDADIARKEAEAGREREKGLKDEAVQQKQRAETALVEVAQQKQRAEANFDKARRAVDEYLTQITESELLTVPGLQPLREDLLEAALKFYSEFTQERADDPTLQRELASAHYRLARIHQELGHADACRKANAEAIRLYEQLRDAGHFDRDMQVALAWAYFFAPRYDDTVKLCQNVLLAAPGHAETRSLLAETYNSQAIAEKDIDAALKHHRQAFDLREALVRDFAENPSYLAQLGSTLNNLGVLLSKQGKNEEALAMYERAAEYSAQAYERAPHSILWGRWLCTGVLNVARIQAALQRKLDALASYQRLVAVSRKRAFENPAVTSLRGELCNAHLYLARYQRQLGNSAEASRSFREAREVLENTPRETAAQLYELAIVYAELAQPAEDAIAPTDEDAAERQRHIEMTLQMLHKAADAGNLNAQSLKADHLFDALRERPDFQQLMATLDKAAQAQQLAGQNAGSADQRLADRLRAAELLNDLVAEQPGAVRHRLTLAATYHSIGLIQTGLKQFAEAEKSFLQALEIRDAVRQAQPGKPDLEVEWIGARIAIGNLYWVSARFPEAHRIWQDCSQKLLEIASAGRDNAGLQQRIAGHERVIGDAYASYALWPLAREYALRNSQFRRITRQAKDSEYAALLLTVDDPTATDDYLALLGDQLKGAEASSPWAITHLVRVAAISRSTALTPDDLISRSRKALATQNGMAWFRAVLATALYRAGEFAEAHEIVGTLGDIASADTHAYSFRQKPYLEAVVASAAGDDREAQASFGRAESLYQGICLETLARPAVDSLGLPQVHWNELCCLQALRREAWLRIKGAAAPDPWQHLIQARGYRLIGETEKAEAELAGAIGAASNDATLWVARARLRDHWGHAARADADWQRAVELAGDDPVTWIQRGRCYAARGEQAKADADFARAFQLAPDHLLCRLERARQNRTVIAVWDFTNGTASLRDHAHCNLSVANGVLTIDSTGGDPAVVMTEFKAGSGRKELTICTRFQGKQAWQVFLSTTRSRFAEDDSVRFVMDGGDGEWREHRVTFDPHADLTSLRFDPPNEAGIHLDLAWIMLAELSDEVVWQRAVESAGDDPLPWIQRGRWYAERGEQAKADADFAKAASLTPQELNKFLEAGWWIVGPYPVDLKEFCPPEVGPDPSQPVYVVDPKGGLSDAPAAWTSVATERWGRVDLTSVRKDNASVYALVHAYSPEEQTKLLMIGKTEPLRVWVNGALVADYAPGEFPVFPDYEPFHRLPIVLRNGLNTVLVKCANTSFTARIGDSARDRATLLVEQRRFAEAFAALNELQFSPADLESAVVTWKLAPLLAMDDGQHKLYGLHCAAALARIAESERHVWPKIRISWVCSQRPNPLFDEHAQRLVSFAEQYAEKYPATGTRLNAALVNYRAGHHERARSLLTQADLSYPLCLPLQALLLHKTSAASSAAGSLDAALSAGAERVKGMRTFDRSDFTAMSWACWWYEWLPFLNLLGEAEQAIRGDTSATDELKASAEETMARRWTESPELAAFDHAVLFTACGPDGHLKFPQPLLARGRRLAELGRFDEAKADFNKALELAPNDPEVLAALAAADARQVERPTTDFWAALQQDAAARSRWAGHWYDRGVRYCKLRQYANAISDFSKAVEIDAEKPIYWHSLAMLQLHSGDRDEYRKLCAELASRFGKKDDAESKLFVAGTCLLAPGSVQDFQSVLDVAASLATQSPESATNRLVDGAALYRSGQWKGAIERIHESQKASVRDLAWPAQELFLAMASMQLGQVADARRWLDTAVKWDQENQDADWRARVLTEILRREAEELLAEKSK